MTVVDRLEEVCPNSRRAKASIVHAPGSCAGAVGALLANGDRTALIRVDTRCDTGSAGVGVMTLDAGWRGAIAGATAAEDVGAAARAATGVAATDFLVDANDDTPAVWRVKTRLLPRVVGSVAAVLTTAGFGLVFSDAEPDPGREEAPPRCRAAVPGVSGGAPARPVEEVDVDGVVCGPPELLAAVSADGLCARR